MKTLTPSADMISGRLSSCHRASHLLTVNYGRSSLQLAPKPPALDPLTLKSLK